MGEQCIVISGTIWWWVVVGVPLPRQVEDQQQFGLISFKHTYLPSTLPLTTQRLVVEPQLHASPDNLN